MSEYKKMFDECERLWAERLQLKWRIAELEALNKDLTLERDALAAKLEIAIEALREISKMGVYEAISDLGEVADSALYQLEQQ